MQGIWYGSVRNNYSDCYALFTPKCIDEVVQGEHYEYVWDGSNLILCGTVENNKMEK